MILPARALAGITRKNFQARSDIFLYARLLSVTNRPMPEDTANISLQVPEEINAWLEKQADSQLTSKSAVIRGMILKERNRLKLEEQNGHAPDTPREL